MIANLIVVSACWLINRCSNKIYPLSGAKRSKLTRQKKLSLERSNFYNETLKEIRIRIKKSYFTHYTQPAAANNVIQY